MSKRIGLLSALLVLAFAAFARKDIWVIDPGHGGHDTGCESRTHREKDITLAVAKEVGRLVRQEIPGVKVVFTRERDVYPTLDERCRKANGVGASLFLSIHVNDAANVFAHGTESYFATNVPLSGTQAGKSELLALLLQRAYLDHGRGLSRGVKQRRLYVCENTNMPSVLTEIGFISNDEEEAFITSAAGQATLARAITDALKQWREMTLGGSVSRRELRNLRFRYLDPKQQAAKKNVAQAKAPEPAKKKNETATTAVVVEPEPQDTTSLQPAVAVATDLHEAPAEPFFSIQIFSVSRELEPSDKRFKGLRDVRLVPAPDGTFKVVHGHFVSYAETRRQLVEVRKLFPDAFVIAFDGDTQITTAEALGRGGKVRGEK